MVWKCTSSAYPSATSTSREEIPREPSSARYHAAARPAQTMEDQVHRRAQQFRQIVHPASRHRPAQWAPVPLVALVQTASIKYLSHILCMLSRNAHDAISSTVAAAPIQGLASPWCTILMLPHGCRWGQGVRITGAGDGHWCHYGWRIEAEFIFMLTNAVWSSFGVALIL